jgi:hypothetical protein
MISPSTRRSALLVLPIVFMTSAACDIAMADFKEQQSAQWTRTYDLQPGGRFELSNVNGRIDAQPSSGNTIEVIADKTSKAASVEAAKQALERIEILESVSPNHVRIETRMQRGSGIFGQANSQVSYTIRLPAGTDTKLTTVNGGIVLSGLSGKLELETTNGGIKATGVSGQVEATTTNGGVEVDLVSVPMNGVKLGCTNGGIALGIPADAKASISARITNGGIDTGGLQVETTGSSSKRRLDGRLNGGGPRIELEGTNGGIRLIRR